LQAELARIPGTRVDVVHSEVGKADIIVTAIGQEYAAVADVAVVPSVRRDVAGGEVSGAGESVSDSSVGVGHLDSSRKRQRSDR
jgi:hypothetical protein